MNDGAHAFGSRALSREDVAGKDILEAGSYNVNGSLSDWVNGHGPRSYVRIDKREGPDVDKVLDVCSVLDEYGAESFDVVFSTEMLEHVKDWVGAVTNMKDAVRPGGIVVLTARAPGATRHDHPEDYWRFSQAAMKQIFADWEVEMLEDDPSARNGKRSKSGVFVKARKPKGPHTPIVLDGRWAMPAPQTAGDA